MRNARRTLTGLAAGWLLVLAAAGSASAYQVVDIPPAACESVRAGIAHFHDSPAPEQMQQTPAWGNTSRFDYGGNC